MKCLLFFISLLLLVQAIRKISFFKELPIKSEVIIGLFLLKSVVGVAYTFLYATMFGATNVDVFNYFNDGLVVTQAFKSNLLLGLKLFFWRGQTVSSELQPYFDQTGYLSNSGDFIIIRLHAILNFISTGFIYTHVLFFNFLSLIGIVSLYKCLLKFYPEKASNGFVLLSLFPSILIFGSGLHKEGVLLFLLGIFSLFFLRANGINLVFSIFAMILMTQLRSYVAGIIFLGLLFLLINLLFNDRKKISGLLFVLIGVIGVLIFKSCLFQEIVEKRNAFQALSDGNSSFYLLPLNMEWPFILFYISETLYNAIFRPSIFPFKSMFNLVLAGLNLMYLLLIVLVVINCRNFKIDAFRLFCLIVSTAILISIAMVVNNEGAIARYKMQVWLFLIPYLMVLLPKGLLDKLLLK